MPRLRELTVNLLVLLGTVLFVFGVLEVAARLLRPHHQTVFVSNLRPAPMAAAPTEERADNLDSLFVDNGKGLRLRRSFHLFLTHHALNGRDIEIRTNALGFRGEELGPKTQDDVRILVLGDSITLGDYAQEAETYPAQIERNLAQMSAGPGRIRVINAGMGSNDLRGEFVTLMDTGLMAQPDVVVEGLYLNDAGASFTLEAVSYPSYVRWSRVATAVLNRTRYLDTLRRYHERELDRREDLERFTAAHPVSGTDDWRIADAGFNEQIVNAFGDWGFAWTDAAWDDMEHTLALMKHVAEDQGIELVVVLFPVRHQVESQLVRDEPQQRFATTMRRLGLPHLDLLPALREKYARDHREIYYDHCHYRPEGDAFNGRQIAKFLATASRRLRAAGVTPERLPAVHDEAAPADALRSEPLVNGMGLTVAANGQLLVADAGGLGSVKRIGADGRFEVPLGGELVRPEGVAVGGGTIYVAETWKHRVLRLSADGVPLDPLPAPASGYYAPRDVTVAPNGHVYVADTGHAQIVHYDDAGRVVGTWGQKGSGDGQLNEPVSLAACKTTVWVADYANARIQAFTSEGRFLTAWPVPEWRDTPPADHAGLACYKNRLYATAPARNAVLVFSGTGQSLGRIESPEIQKPTGLAVSASGTLFIDSYASGSVAAVDVRDESHVGPVRRFAPPAAVAN